MSNVRKVCPTKILEWKTCLHLRVSFININECQWKQRSSFVYFWSIKMLMMAIFGLLLWSTSFTLGYKFSRWIQIQNVCVRKPRLENPEFPFLTNSMVSSAYRSNTSKCHCVSSWEDVNIETWCPHSAQMMRENFFKTILEALVSFFC